MAKAAAKTRPTRASVDGYVAGIEDAAQRADCKTLLRLMRKVTGEQPVMWGPGIVGFGWYAYRYASGRSGESCATGFAARKRDISVYLVAPGARQDELLCRLGKHRMAKACLSIKRLSEIDLRVLEQLVADSVAEVRRRYPDP